MGKFLFFVIIILYIIISAKNKKKKKAADAAKNKNKTFDDAFTPIRTAPSPAKKAAAPQQMEMGESFTDAESCVGETLPHEKHSGTGYSDEEGCVGGSLPHTEHEGTGFADAMNCVGGSLPHESHEGGDTVIRNSWQDSKVAVHTRNVPSAEEMRRAVIMNEILQRPVSMRGKRGPNA